MYAIKVTILNKKKKKGGGEAAYQWAYLWQLGNTGKKRSCFLLQEWQSMSLLTDEEMPKLKINIQ